VKEFESTKVASNNEMFSFDWYCSLSRKFLEEKLLSKTSIMIEKLMLIYDVPIHIFENMT